MTPPLQRRWLNLRTARMAPRQAGFTLVELVISIVLLGLLAAVGASMLKDTFATAQMVNADNASAGSARYAMERLARELREIKYVGTSSAGSYCITTMTATQMVFRKHVSGSEDYASCGTGDIAVTVNWASPNLTLQYSSPALTSALSNKATGFVLTFLPLNADGTTTGTATNANIRFVGIDLTVNDPASGQPTRQRVRVALRNSL